MPTREQIEAELAKLPPEQHAAFLAAVEERMKSAGQQPIAESTPPTESVQPPSEPGEYEYQQASSDVTALGDVGKGALYGVAKMGAGALRPAEDVLGAALRAAGLDEMADLLESNRTQGMGMIEDTLGPSDPERTEAHTIGRLAGTTAPIVAAPAGAMAQATLGAGTAAAQALGEGEGYDDAALDAAVAGALPAFGKLAAKVSPWLRTKAARAYSSMFGPETEEAKAKFAERLMPVLEGLPIGGRGRIRGKAKTMTEEVTGPRVGELYNVDTPASFEPTKRKLAELAGKDVRREAKFDSAGKLISPQNVRYPKRHKAYDALIKEMTNAEMAANASGKPLTVQDLFKERSTAAEMAKSRSFKVGGKPSDLDPKTQALLAKREALSETMHEIVHEGKVADAVHSAWETVKEGTKGSDPGMFPVRWLLSRVFGGIMGTTAGFMATKPAFWSSLGSKTLLKLSQAAKAGDEATAIQIIRSGIENYQKAHPEEIPDGTR